VADDYGISSFFGNMDSVVKKATARGLKYVEDELAAGRVVVFRKPETVDLIKNSSLYEYVDLPGGAVQVIKVDQNAKNIFEGKTPPSSSTSEGNVPPSVPAKPGKASKSNKSFDEVPAGINAAANQPEQTPSSQPVDPKKQQKLLEIRAAIEASRRAREANREGQGLNPEMTREQREDAATMRDPVVANTEGRSDPRSLRRAPKIVRIGGKEIELPEDYAQRKKFRKYRNEEIEKKRDELAAAPGRRRAQDQRTAEQLRGTLGRAGRRAGLAVGGAVKGLPKIPLPSARNPLVRFGLRYNKNIGGMRGGLAGLGALAGGALVGKLIQSGAESSEIEQQRMEDLRRSARRDMLDLLGRKEHKQALQMNINDNLAQLQAQAPDLYMSVAAGRRLPQGAVVIGGVPRQDLLQQLGMSMSNGDFNQ
jgi:hypothetical protein